MALWRLGMPEVQQHHLCGVGRPRDRDQLGAVEASERSINQFAHLHDARDVIDFSACVLPEAVGAEGNTACT